MEESQIAAALGKLPSGLYILTARHGDLETGMLCSWVQQAGFVPPMITLAVNHDRYLVDWLSDGAKLALNVLGEEQKSFIKHFGRGFEPEKPAFEGLDVRRGANGAMLLDEAIAYFEATVRGHVDAGDHRVFLAEVTAAGARNGAAPLVHLRKNGLRY